MIIRFSPQRVLRDADGSTLIYVAVALTVLLAFAALAIDIGYAMVARNELQNVADSAALAAARYIGKTYEGKTYEEQQNYTFSSAAIVSAAKAVAVQNQAAGTNIDLNDADVFIGKWNGTTHTLGDIGNMTLPDAVRVIARRDASTVNGSIPTFFARVLGIATMDVAATGTAALTGQSTAGPGGLFVPVGISRAWFNPNSCNQVIQFSPTGTLTGCAGWNTFTDPKVNDNNERTLLEGLTAGTFQSPETMAGVTIFNYIGGNLSNPTFADFTTLFNTMKVKNDGVMDQDNDPTTWTTGVVVYDWPDCSNPNKPITTVGFATAQIFDVQGAPAKTIFARVLCNLVDQGRSGGGNYGTKGSIPGLVQ
jgi:Putative Flp pilus-assembly TadE/G-like